MANSICNNDIKNNIPLLFVVKVLFILCVCLVITKAYTKYETENNTAKAFKNKYISSFESEVNNRKISSIFLRIIGIH